MTRKRARQPVHIQPPQLPPHLSPADTADQAFGDHAEYTQLALIDTDLTDQTAEDVLFDQVTCQRIRLTQAQLPLAQVHDSRFDTCDLAGAVWEKAHWRRVELVGCRIMGLQLIDAQLEDVVFHKCTGELVRVWSTTCKAVGFEECALREASFAGSNLSGVIFRNCDLRSADFRETKLQGADLRGSNVEGMQVGLQELRGAIIDPTQAVHLAGLLGIIVKEHNDA